MEETFIPARLRELREKADVSQEIAAESCGISRVSLARYETGARVPELKIAARLAKYYGVPTDYLLGHDLPVETVSTQKRTAILAQLESIPDDKLDQVLEYAQFLAGRQDAPHKAGKIETIKTDIQHK